jgi:uncharacterized protein YigE (DUF2233 family)
MKMTLKLFSCSFLAILLIAFAACSQNDATFLLYQIAPGNNSLKMYWKNDSGWAFKSIGNLKASLQGQHKKLDFAMNGGMYHAGNLPVGLYVEAGKMRHPIDTGKGEGNFYLLPNGVFFITHQHTFGICPTQEFHSQTNIAYATQSGPMLLTDGQINPAFQPQSKNLNIRNGVGLLPDGTAIFALSKTVVNFFEFARLFQKAGCKQALYLDGFVSRAYLPTQDWEQTDGDFGVIIAAASPL